MIRRELTAELALINVKVHEGQLREAVVNLINNAIEAMANNAGRDRALRVGNGGSRWQ